jgi:hypothetical protein
MEQLVALAQSGSGEPSNKGKLVGQKAPLRLKEIWAIRIRLQLAERTRELALFNLAVDSKLRSCDLVTLRVRDITHGERIAARAIVMQQCSVCGTSLTHRHELCAGDLDFTLVCLDTVEGIEPQVHIWVQDKLSWVHIDDGRPQFKTVPGHDDV